MGSERTFVVMQCELAEVDMRGVIHHFEDGPREGYEIRFRLTFPPGAPGGQRSEWTPWAFGSHRTFEGLADYLKTRMAEGHRRSSAPPDSTVQ